MDPRLAWRPVRLSRQRLECVCLSTAFEADADRVADTVVAGGWAKAAMNRTHSKRWRDFQFPAPCMESSALPNLCQEPECRPPFARGPRWNQRVSSAPF